MRSLGFILSADAALKIDRASIALESGRFHVPVICPLHGNQAEIEKLERLDERLTDLFTHAGDADVQLCEATGEGSQRKLTLYRSPDISSLISRTSIASWASTSGHLCQMIEQHRQRLKSSMARHRSQSFCECFMGRHG